MSHTVTVKTQFKNHTILKKVCDRLKYKMKKGAITQKFYSSTASGDLSIEIPGWRYPIVVKDGNASMDNFNGSWGKQEQFDQLSQEYAKEVSIQEAHNAGYTVEQRQLVNGTVELYLT